MMPDHLTEQKRYRELLDQVLQNMDDSIRSVFVLYSFEEMTMAEIAALLDIPSGTVASRLRRAREVFKQEIMSLQNHDNQESA
jgi:RNA polymerase sigma-70 factor (ECF subfamily)